MFCKFGVKRRLVIPVILVPTPPKYFALPRVSTWLPTDADLPQTSQALDMFHLKFNEINGQVRTEDSKALSAEGSVHPQGKGSISATWQVAMSNLEVVDPIDEKTLGNYTEGVFKMGRSERSSDNFYSFCAPGLA